MLILKSDSRFARALVRSCFGFAVLCQPSLHAAVPARDDASDAVGASVGRFAVDESGNASYELPLALVPGTAGVAPKVSLVYNSGAGVGALGRGWSVSGSSSITRCRKTREAGDFLVGGLPIDGNSKPVSYSADDVFCLDGQRLVLVSGIYGASGAEYRLELDPFTKVMSYGGDNGIGAYTGPLYFAAKRKDGSTQYYGNTADSRIMSRCLFTTVRSCQGVIAAIWALNRSEDSTGNYIDYSYILPEFSYLGEGTQYLLSSVTYTGKRALTGQTGASMPYAGVYFQYQVKVPPAGQDASLAYQGGVAYVQDQELMSIEVRDRIDTFSPRVIRYYEPTYRNSASGSNKRLLTSLQECRDGSKAVCYPATAFAWSDDFGARHAFDSADRLTGQGESRDLKSARLGDMDGDGRLDLVWFRAAGASGVCAGGNLSQVSFADRLESAGRSILTLVTPNQSAYCSYLNASNGELNTAWGLMDFDGDGRDDLLIADNDSTLGARWHIYPSLGRPNGGGAVFDTSRDLINVVIPTEDDSQEQAQLGDFNGDGLLDFLHPSGSGLAIRFMQRRSDNVGFEFSAPYSINPQFRPGSCDGCNLQFFNLDQAGFGVAPDLDGDGRSDLVLRAQRVSSPSAHASSTAFSSPLPSGSSYTYYSPEQLAELERQGATASDPVFYAFVMDVVSGSTQQLRQYGNALYAFSGTGPLDTREFQFPDLNGDGLPDLVYQQDSTTADFTYALNLGTGFQSAGTYAFTGQIRNVQNRQYLQWADINGDGGLDLLYPSETSLPCPGSSANSRVFCYRSFNYRTGIVGGIDNPASPSPQNDAQCLSNNVIGETLTEWKYFFADFDGDGATDFVKLRDGGTTPSIYTSRANSHHQPKDVITRITSGLGAVTQIQYQPLTNKAIYRRAQNSRSLRYGRLSPVQDVLSPTYVVSAISSSAPTQTDPNAMSTIAYRYSGAKAQAGGRGFLGFAEIATLDMNAVDGGFAVTTQAYRQDFPFVGQSYQTAKWRVGGVATRGNASLDACAANIEAAGQDCFYDPSDARDATHPVFGLGAGPDTLNLSGQLIQIAASLYHCNGLSSAACSLLPTDSPDRCPSTGLASLADPVEANSINSLNAMSAIHQASGSSLTDYRQQPLFAHVVRTGDADLDPTRQTVSRYVCGLMQYQDGFGNLTSQTMVHFADGSNGSEIARKATQNTYSNDAINWRLGRLTQSTIQDTRGGITQSRSTEFDYEVDKAGYSSSSDTGLLKAERLQRDIDDSQDLRTLYTLDDYGNTLYAFQCSRRDHQGNVLIDANCRNPSVVRQRPVAASGPTAAVHRYTRSLYSANGRYLTHSYLPFFNEAAPNQLNEQAAVSYVEADGSPARDEFGNITHEVKANGLIAQSLYGSLGRPYYQEDNTGRSSTTIYRWCTSTSCPQGSRFRSQTSTRGAPTSFTYYDVLGRAMLSVNQSFQAISGQSWQASCQAYDSHGRVIFSSIPFFLSSSAGAGAEPLLNSQNVCAGRAGTTTSFDTLGRVRQVTQADGSIVTQSYSDLSTTTVDTRGQQSQASKNVLGEVLNQIQANAATGGIAGGMNLQHEYDAMGNLRFVRRNAGQGEVVSEIRYDALGRKTQVIDPDKGMTRYTYNAAGEIIRMVDGKGQVVEQDYDALGRLWRRKSGPASAFGGTADAIFQDGFESGGIGSASTSQDKAQAGAGSLIIDTWRFDTAASGLGQLEQVQREINGVITYSKIQRYDGIGRPYQTITSFDAASYTETVSYDSLGRINATTDATGGTVTHQYSAVGYLQSLRDSNTSIGNGGLFYETLSQDAWGHELQVRRANAITTSFTYHPQRGFLESVQTPGLQDWQYRWDSNGNLSQRQKGALLESFSYDYLNRLIQVSSTAGNISFNYDGLGNLCTKGPQTYSYAGRDGCNGAGISGSPHAVSQINDTTFQYDANGNQILQDAPGSASDRTIVYDALDQAIQIQTLSNQTEFAYAPDGSRYKRIDREGGVIRTTRYIGSVEIIIASGTTTSKRYLPGNAIISTINGMTEERYALPDHLGSIDLIVNKTGVIQEQTSFDAWGARRNPATRSGPAIPLNTTTRGYTGHEQLDALNVIHMNGRIYDPQMGRFLQADPLIDQGVQGLNRYSYVLNNPLSATDPTGHLSAHQAGQIFMAAILTLGTGGFGAAAGTSLTATQGFIFAGANGFMAGAIQSGTLKGGAWGAFSAIAFHSVGSYFESAEWAHSGSSVAGTNLNAIGYTGKILAHGVLGGALQNLQGGKFGSGFAAAGLTQAASGAIDTIDPANPGFSAARVVAAAMLGGTVSHITGGKFAHGAVTASFARAFNAEAHLASWHQKARNAFRLLAEDLEGASFSSEIAAANAFGDAFVPFTEKYGLEVGSNIEAGNFQLANLTLGSSSGVHLPENSLAIADVHTHPVRAGPGFSGTLRYVGGRLQTSFSGDYSSNFERRTNGYVFGAGGSRPAWKFDYVGFEASYRASLQTGTDTYAEWFTRKIR